MHRLVITMALMLTSLVSQAASLHLTLLDRDGQPLQDAVVVLYAVGGATPPPPSAPSGSWVINQEKMKFEPALTVTVPGANLRVTNLDRYDHHVIVTKGGMAEFSDANPDGFEMYLNGRKEGKDPSVGEHQVTKPGVYLLGCHLHGSMRGHVFVTDSAWTQKTDDNGQVRFDGLQAQAIEVRVWHPALIFEGPRQPVKLTDGIIQKTLNIDVNQRRRKG